MDNIGDTPVSLPHREAMQNTLSSKDHSGHGIPQASVRPLVRPVIMSAGKHEHEHDLSRLEDSKPPALSKTNTKQFMKVFVLCLQAFSIT